MVYRYFAGGNTGEGFYNCFEHIIPGWIRDEKTYILKGGPGVGKNTMMKEIAKYAKENNDDVELFYCSGDPDSLDAVRIPKKKFVILDGTAPHIREPRIPGVTASIVNLGMYLEEEKLTEKKGELERLFAENKDYYRKAYLELQTAYELQKREMPEKNDSREESRKVRKLFLQTISYQGIIDYTEEYLADKEVRELKEKEDFDLMQSILEQFENSPTELFFDPLLPNQLRVIHIPEQNLTFRIQQEKRLPCVESFIEAGIRFLMQCKRTHDEIENIYKPCMNFDAVTIETNRLLNKIHYKSQEM